MPSIQVAVLEHMTCECGRHPRLMKHTDAQRVRYTAETYCCKTITVPLKTERAAAYEFQRIRAVQASDPDTWPEDKINPNVLSLLRGSKP